MNQQELSILKKQTIPWDHMDALKELSEIYNEQNSLCFLVAQAFNYGVMEGKRAERARRKKEEVSSLAEAGV